MAAAVSAEPLPLPLGSLRAILESHLQPAGLLRLDGRLLAANDAFRRAFCVADPVGRCCWEIMHRADAPCGEQQQPCPLRLCSVRARPQRIVHRHHSGSAAERHVVTAYPIPSGNGTRYCIAVTNGIPHSALRWTGMIGRSPSFLRVLEMLHCVAPTDTPVLLLGESGTGKELAARAVHDLSSRAAGPFIAVDCSGLPESLFESELFGHEKGAFTGALERKHGLVESADRGTLFLDEIGDLPPNLQVKLLRLLETNTFRRVGGLQPIASDFRLVCATNQDLTRLVTEQTFRSDLYYRISVFPVRLPPLRQRPDDLPVLAEALLKRLSPDAARRIHPAALECLQRHRFEGNVRELRNILARAALLAEDGVIRPEHLGEMEPSSRPRGEPPVAGEVLTLIEAEQRYLQWAVESFRGDRAALARRLGVSERSLYRRLRELRDRS